MDPTAYRPEENVNRVACLDAFLQRFSGGAGSGSDSSDGFTQRLTTGNNASSTPTTPRTSDRNGTPSGVRGDGVLAVGEEGSDGGDLRAVTSGIAGGGSGGGGGRGGRGIDSGSASGSCGGVGVAGSTGIAGGRDATAVAAAAQAEILKVLDFLFCSDRPLACGLCVFWCAIPTQVLDKSRVVKVVARNTGRSVWLVQGSRGAPYLCLREYCSCSRSFQELVRRGALHPVLCKHLLAVRLAPALGLSMSEEVDDEKLAMRISSCDYGG
ncbi:unnamed protein product [Ectocarpus sp. 6 AP-2014]